MCPAEMSAHAHRQASAGVFVAALATIAVDWKQPECAATAKTKGTPSKNINYTHTTDTDGAHRNRVEQEAGPRRRHIARFHSYEA